MARYSNRYSPYGKRSYPSRPTAYQIANQTKIGAGRSFKRRLSYPAARVMVATPEKKVVDTTIAAYAANTTGSITLINGAASGADFTQRIGRKQKNVSIQTRGSIAADATGPTNAQMARFMMVYDCQPNGALPAITDVLLEATATSMMNLNNRDRFKVIWDKQFALAPFNTAAAAPVAVGGPSSHQLNVFRKIDLETVYDGTTAGIADIQTGSIFFLSIGTAAAGTGDAQMLASHRVRFTDL